MQLNIKSFLNSTVFLKSIFVVSLFILIFISSVTYKHIVNRKKSFEALEAAHKTTLVLEQVKSNLKDAETGHRGYLITKDSLFLEPFYNSRQKIENNLSSLKLLTTNTLQQQKNLKSLSILVDLKYGSFNKILVINPDSILNEKTISKYMLNDKAVMDTIREKVDKMVELENTYLAMREKEHNTNMAITPLLTLLLFMFPLGVLVVSYTVMNKNLLILKEANKALIINSESMKHAQQIGEFCTSIWDINTHKITYSDNFFSLLGYEPQTFKPTIKAFLRLVHPNDQHIIIKSVRQVIENEEASIIYFRIKHADGGVRYFKSIGKMLADNKNRQTMIAVMSDITAEHQRNLDLEIKNKELAQSNIELANFNQIASHDLQEPLRKIQIFISRIEDNEKNNLSDSGKEFFEKIKSAAQRMRALIDDLLLFSSTNKEEKIYENTNLNQILETVIQEISETIQEKNAIIDANKLPTIAVIPFQIQQLFSNLLGNALKYSKLTDIPKIRISCQKIIAKQEPLLNLDSSQVFHKITFADNGLGFDQQHANKIFTLFHRLHQASEYSGTGIGLAICKKIVENHNGYIFAEGKLSIGATFTIYLPE